MEASETVIRIGIGGTTLSKESRKEGKNRQNSPFLISCFLMVVVSPSDA
jgi:hypothetical protein